jgi:hypothetical protein
VFPAGGQNAPLLLEDAVGLRDSPMPQETR